MSRSSEVVIVRPDTYEEEDAGALGMMAGCLSVIVERAGGSMTFSEDEIEAIHKKYKKGGLMIEPDDENHTLTALLLAVKPGSKAGQA